MRVLIDTTYALRAPNSGTGIYIQRLCEALDQTGDVEVVPAANRGRRAPAGGGVRSLANLAADLRWSALELPRLARRAGAELIHHPLPALAPGHRRPQVITVVDLAFERIPEAFDRGYRCYAHLIHRAAARAADAVICISETTAADARELWRVAPERIVVAPLGPGQVRAGETGSAPSPRPAPPPRHALAPRHFLYVGDAEPRKNLAVLLSAYERYRAAAPRPLGLVLAGSASARAPGVRVVTGPDQNQLIGLYREAAALVHPSRYEGFGLTALEAMTLGTPVLAARSPGIVEVCGDAARLADPRDPRAFATALAELAGDPALRAELSRRGRVRAERFSWAACARAHVDAYSLALSQ